LKSPVATCRPSIEEIRGNPVVPLAHERIRESVLAFDISSTCCGWALGRQEQLDRYGKITFRTTAGISEKLAAFHELVMTLLTVYRPDTVILEMPQSRRAKVTARHYEYVGVLRALSSKLISFEIEQEHFVAPVTVKKWLGVPKGQDHADNKRIMVNTINAVCGINLKFDAASKNATDDDVADAIAVLLTWYRRGEHECLPKKRAK
jgi:Holliday junction resolvasome RuvABC endonuclease subunit